MASAPHPLIIGHRGSPGYRPEHTEASYLVAIQQGADAVEPDIVVSRDGVLVVRHENEISGTTDVADHPEFADRKTAKVIDGVRLQGWFTEDFTWQELSTLRCRERLPKVRPQNTAFDGAFPLLRLRDVLALIDAADRPLLAVLEVKHAAYFASLGFDIAALLSAELTDSGWNDHAGQLVIESFELGVLDRLRAAGIPATYIFLMESEGAPADEVMAFGVEATSYERYRTDAVLALLPDRVDGISIAKADLFVRDTLGFTSGYSDLVTRAHALGLSVFVWTLRPENRFLNIRYRSSLHQAEWGHWPGEYALALESGVDGLFVDHVDLGIQARQNFVSVPGSTLEQ